MTKGRQIMLRRKKREDVFRAVTTWSGHIYHWFYDLFVTTIRLLSWPAGPQYSVRSQRYLCIKLSLTVRNAVDFGVIDVTVHIITIHHQICTYSTYVFIARIFYYSKYRCDHMEYCWPAGQHNDHTENAFSVKQSTINGNQRGTIWVSYFWKSPYVK